LSFRGWLSEGLSSRGWLSEFLYSSCNLPQPLMLKSALPERPSLRVHKAASGPLVRLKKVLQSLSTSWPNCNMTNGTTPNPPGPTAKPTSGKAPSFITTTTIQGPDNVTNSGVVYIDHGGYVNWLLYKGDESANASSYIRQDRIAFEDTLIKATKVSVVNYSTGKSHDLQSNQVSPYQSTIV
jgi:hypothetical protein